MKCYDQLMMVEPGNPAAAAPRPRGFRLAALLVVVAIGVVLAGGWAVSALVADQAELPAVELTK